jgi:hypothetical protein
MRTSNRTLFALAALAFAACDVTGAVVDGGTDLQPLPDLVMQSQPDFAQPAGDLAQSLWGCDKVATCAVACGTSTGCQIACYNNGSAHAQALIQSLAACIGATCTSANGGLGRCVVYPGDSSLDCTLCIDNSTAGGVTGVACAPVTDSACGRCSNESEACLLDQ